MRRGLRVVLHRAMHWTLGSMCRWRGSRRPRRWRPGLVMAWGRGRSTRCSSSSHWVLGGTSSPATVSRGCRCRVSTPIMVLAQRFRPVKAMALLEPLPRIRSTRVPLEPPRRPMARPGGATRRSACGRRRGRRRVVLLKRANPTPVRSWRRSSERPKGGAGIGLTRSVRAGRTWTNAIGRRREPRCVVLTKPTSSTPVRRWATCSARAGSGG